MNKELIEAIVKEYSSYEDINAYQIAMRSLLTKHLSDKVIVEKKVLEEMRKKQDLVIREQNLYHTPAWDFHLQLQSLLDNQE